MRELEKLARDKGLSVRECAPGHFQISGKGCVVNYYPTSKRRTAYITGSEGKGKRFVTPEEAIEMALSVPVDDTPEKPSTPWWGSRFDNSVPYQSKGGYKWKIG